MGCYNSIEIKCPNCSNVIELQSKGGSCNFEEFKSYKVPINDALYIEDDQVTCRECKSSWRVVIPSIPQFVQIILCD